MGGPDGGIAVAIARRGNLVGIEERFGVELAERGIFRVERIDFAELAHALEAEEITGVLGKGVAVGMLSVGGAAEDTVGMDPGTVGGSLAAFTACDGAAVVVASDL